MGYLTLESELGECAYWLDQAADTWGDILTFGLVVNRERTTQAAKLVTEALEKIKQASELLRPDFEADKAKEE